MYILVLWGTWCIQSFAYYCILPMTKLCHCGSKSSKANVHYERPDHLIKHQDIKADQWISCYAFTILKAIWVFYSKYYLLLLKEPTLGLAREASSNIVKIWCSKLATFYSSASVDASDRLLSTIIVMQMIRNAWGAPHYSSVSVVLIVIYCKGWKPCKLPCLAGTHVIQRIAVWYNTGGG